MRACAVDVGLASLPLRISGLGLVSKLSPRLQLLNPIARMVGATLEGDRIANEAYPQGKRTRWKCSNKV
ncbi:hypothetical protein ACFX10_017809 [Malus domestica]